MSQEASLQGLSCLADYAQRAGDLLPAATWAYVNAGAAGGITQRRNAAAFEQLMLWPRVLRRISKGNTELELFGKRYAHPIFIAPTAFHALAHADAERATAIAAAALQAVYVVSTQASVSLEDVAAAAPGPRWFQLYWQADKDVNLDLLRRAEAAGYEAIVMTVDAPIQGSRNAEQRHGFSLPVSIKPVNLLPYADKLHTPGVLEAGQSLFQHPLVTQMANWDDVAWLVKQTTLPVLVKGILHPADAQLAVQAGAAGVIVSNHGGRVLDSVPAALDVLPLVVAAVGGHIPVLVDGGIQRGTDVVKALALGAKAVLIGRPVLHGLAVAGATGVAHILHLLRTELESSMVLSGVGSLEDIDASLLWQGSNTR